jgi:serine/threonine-protein kinase
MTLSAGMRIGPYEVTGTLGAGGMGEVYRGHDARLGRDVALKVLPDVFAGDSERLARFQREAQVLAALKHPNIGAIYGLEEGPAEAGHYVRALVLELVEGDTLADWIARGAGPFGPAGSAGSTGPGLPLDEALPIARQVAEALEAAHEQGVIHRDLKPANIKVAPDRLVKVLDFGLAKLTSAAGSGPYPANTMSPTLSVQATMAGVILGTAAYMSPEQARGRPVDRRADIWAFGCVLYEMLTGRRAFDGQDITDTIVAIVSKDPDWSALPAATPEAIRALLQRCLDKDAKRRLRDIGEARLTFEDAAATPVAGMSAAPSSSAAASRWRRVAGVALAVCAAAVVAGVAVWVVIHPDPPRVSRLVITPSSEEALTLNVDRILAISPDGMHIVYAGASGSRLFLRRLDQLEPISL